jgi:hypothetical protein
MQRNRHNDKLRENAYYGVQGKRTGPLANAQQNVAEAAVRLHIAG